MRPLSALAAVTLFLGLAAPSAAQNGRWQAYPSYANVQALTASGDAMWAGTEGGLFRYAPATGEIERFTPVEGLSRVDVQAVAYDEERDAVWIGYTDGVLDRLDASTGAVESFFDIAQADRFNARGINRIEVVADSLLIATEFGVVVFDAVQSEVSDTYERFGTLPGGVSVGDVLIAPLPDGAPGLWVGTREGIAYAPLGTPNFREPSAWTVDESALIEVLSLAHFAGDVYAGTAQVRDDDGDVLERGGGFRRAGGVWERFTGADRSFWDLFVSGDELVAVTVFQVLLVDADGGVRRFRIDDTGAFQTGALGPGGLIWAGSGSEGLIAHPPLEGLTPGTVEAARRVVPDGPLTNAIQDLAVDPEGDVWLGFRSFNPTINGFARFDGTDWTNFSLANGALPDRATIRVAHADERGNVWFGTEGRGVFHYAPGGEITLYTPENSTLRPSSSSNPNYIVAVGLGSDDAGRLWVTNRFAAPPLHVRTPEGEWIGVERPDGIPSAFAYDHLYIDSFGQKWITEQGGGGLLVLDTGADLRDTGDDRTAYVGSVGDVGTGLPDTQVNAVIEDLNGRIWIGTDRGLATVFSPGSALAGSLASQITWARTADETDFFLRDLRIFDIEVDPANRKWLASSSGVWLINAEGDEVLANFTTENSPLPSDVVVAVEVDDESGAVHFVTSGGLYTYDGDAVAPAPVAEDLFVYPNPVRGNGGALPEIAIEGLVDDADVRVLSVDGQVVASFRTRGGSVRWDGRDQRTGSFVPSGVYLVAANGQDGEGTAYGKIAVIR
jgi:ligand-binding sensor domain-containing protein